jgi:dTDP-glucose pyrophosphorylase
MITGALLLNGGLGTRIYPLGKFIPKCLIPVYDAPLIMHQINILESVGVKNIFIVINRTFEMIIKQSLDMGYSGNAWIKYIIQEESNGCGEATFLGSRYLSDRFFLILGDEYFESDLFFNQAAINSQFEHILGLTQYDSDQQIMSGCHVVVEENEVVGLFEKPKREQITSRLCWNGAAVTTPEIFEQLKELKMTGKVDPVRGVILVEAFIKLMEKGKKIGAIFDPSININVTDIEDYISATKIERKKCLKRLEKSTGSFY